MLLKSEFCIRRYGLSVGSLKLAFNTSVKQPESSTLSAFPDIKIKKLKQLLIFDTKDETQLIA